MLNNVFFLSEDRGKCFNFFCTGGRNPKDPDNPMDNQENMMMKFFRDKLGVFLGRKIVKFVIIITFLVYLGFGLWGCTKVKEGLERFKMARYDSYSLDYYDLEDKYFRKYPYRIQVVINKTLDYSDPKVQEEVENLLHKLENNRLMAGPRFTESWLRIYHRFLKDDRTQVFLQGFNMSKKEDFYKGIRQVFFRLSQNYFQQDIKFNEDFTEITASRFVLQTENIMDANDEKNMLLELRQIAENSTLPVVVFNQLFVLFDQFLLIKETSIQAVGVATAVMMVISFIFIPIPSCALWVAFSIFSIEIGVVGYMSWWNVNLDAISMINLILCIGFSVDYSAHITYAYISSEQKDPNIRMRNALHSLGLPIAQGSVSTLIGIVVLNAAPSYIFTVFFKTVFLVILFAAIHGLLLLPVLLSLTDGWCSGSKKSSESSTEKDGSPPFYIDPRHSDILGNHDGKVASATYRTIADPHFPTIIEEPKYKTTATWTDNELDQGIGTSGESSDGSWRGGNDEIIDHSHQLHDSNSKLTSVGQPGDSPRSREREDHVNPGFVDDEGLKGSRMRGYHRSKDGGYHERWNDLEKSSPRKNNNSRDISSRRNSDPDSPLSRYMSRLNSGYVREFQLPL